MTTHTATQLTSPHDLLAAVPFMVGYHPANSLVVISLRDGQVSMAMRVDFPSLDIASDIAITVASHLTREGAESVIVVGYLPETNVEIDPLLFIRQGIESRGISIKESIVVKAGRFRSTMCIESNCCPLEGTSVPPLSDSRITAERVASGKPLPYLDLDQMRASIASTVPDKDLTRALKKIFEIDYDVDCVLDLQREGAHAVNKLITEFEQSGISKDYQLIALVLTRLLDLQVRDYAMGMTTVENSKMIWDMWRWLLRIAPRGYVAPVATVFAASSYELGEGALAQRALDRAFEDDPKYQMAKLLRRTFTAGWPPSAFTEMRADLHPKICAALFSAPVSE